jgi:phycoerythrin-associated linker protein
MGNLAQSASLGLDAFETAPLKFRPNLTEDEDTFQLIVRAVYRQVLGNVHVMESQALDKAESFLHNGEISVKGFVRAVAQSSLYKSLFFEKSSPYRFIELNFKHLLGRAPQDQAEIAEHVLIYHEQGYEAEINSYLDSDEYNQSFGENTVPYPRGIQTQVGLKNNGFNRMFSLLRGSATSDSGSTAVLASSVAANKATSIKPLAKGTYQYGNTGKRFKIAFSSSQASAQLQRFSQQTCIVSFELMSETVKSIHRNGGRILNIAEVA